MSILLRTVAAGRLPLSNMYEFSSTFIFLAVLVYLLFERWYGVRQLGAIVLPLVVGMAAYVWSLPADLREVDALIPALQNRPLMTVHVSMAILAYATFAVAFAAAVLFLIANRWRVAWLPSAGSARRSRLSRGDDRVPGHVAGADPRLGLGLSRLGHLLAVGSEGDGGALHLAHLRRLPAHPLPARLAGQPQRRDPRWSRSRAVIFTYFGNYVFGGLHAYGGV